MDLLFKNSGWYIKSAWGGSGTVGTPVARLQVGVSGLFVPIEQEASKAAYLLEGAGLGAVVGFSPELVFWSDAVNVSFSTQEMPATGTAIYCRKDAGNVAAQDFEGLVTLVTGSGTLGFGSTGLSIAIWHRQPIICNEASWSCRIARASAQGLMISSPSVSFALHTYAVGLIAGSSLTSDLVAAGVSAFTYHVKTFPAK